MQAKQTKPQAQGRAKRGRLPRDVSVAATIHVSGETFEILSNVTLARESANVAKAFHVIKVKPRDRDRSVAAVIEGLIEHHHPALEAEGEEIRVKLARHRAAEKRRKAKAVEKQRRNSA